MVTVVEVVFQEHNRIDKVLDIKNLSFKHEAVCGNVMSQNLEILIVDEILYGNKEIVPIHHMFAVLHPDFLVSPR